MTGKMVHFKILIGLACSTVSEVDKCPILIGCDVDRFNMLTIYVKLWTEIGWKGIRGKHVKP